MPPNLSVSTGFDLFLTAHEHVANSYIDAYVYIHFYAFAGPGGTLKKIKALFSHNEEHCISKEVKGNALALNDKSC